MNVHSWTAAELTVTVSRVGNIRMVRGIQKKREGTKGKLDP